MSRRIFLSLAFATLALAATMTPVRAVLPSEVLSDPVLEARARALSTGLRCLVCQNQSIDDSDAPLAADLRILLRERIAAGDSDAEVIDYLVDRYGEFILLKPRFNVETAILWAAPFVILLIAGGVAIHGYRSRRQIVVPAATSLSAGEQEALKRIVSADAEGGNITKT